MIGRLRGRVVESDGNLLILDVGGVGYAVQVPVPLLSLLPASGEEEVALHVHTSVREDDISLFGFADPTSLRVFRQLISISGVGPKAALGILSVMDADRLAQAVASQDVRALTRVPGIGAKTAQRLVLELGDKLAALAFERKVDRMAAKARVPDADLLEDIASALVNLGFVRAEAERAAEATLREEPGRDARSLIPLALKRLTEPGGAPGAKKPRK